MFEEKGSMCNFEENLWNKKFDQNHYGTPMQFDGIIAKLMDSFFFCEVKNFLSKFNVKRRMEEIVKYS